MHCLDCASDGDNRPALGVCSTCGAGVCEAHLRIGRQTIRDFTGLAPTEATLTELRTVACLPCATALSAHHVGRYEFAPFAERVRKAVGEAA